MEKYCINPNDYQIMIVDDEHIIRVLTEELLKDAGYRVIGFTNPVEAVKYYKDHFQEIDFVILDMMMPELNGSDVYYKLHSINPFVLAVVLSGYEGVETKYKYLLDDGLYGFLMKPVDIETLNSKIKEIIMSNFLINTECGLSTLMNKEQIYIKLLQTYYEENCNLDNKILELLQKNDLDGVANIIHKIKGISLNLSSYQTFDLSKKLNRKFVDNDYVMSDIIYFLKHHYILIKDIERILRQINVQES